MENKYFSLDERPEKAFVSILMVVFGILCIGTSGWWAVFLMRSTEQQGTYWIATIFLLLFGIYQVYAGFGYARRYIKINGDSIIIRQNSFFPAKEFDAGIIANISIRSADVIFTYDSDKSFKLKLGIRYPDLGERVKSEIVSYAEINNIDVLYKYDISE